MLETISQAMINQANEERPGGIDTGFIVRVTAEREAFVAPDAMQQTAKGQGRQARAQRDAAFARVIESRRTIQYAADVLWPCRKPECQLARTDFRIPANRPYSY